MAKNDKSGRKVGYTDEQKQRVLSLAAQGHSIRKISQIIGSVSKSAVHRILRGN